MSDLHSIMAGAAFVKFSLDNTQFQKGLKQSQSRLKRFYTELSTASGKLSLAVFMLSRPFMAMINNFAEFELKMKRVKGITNASSKAFEELTQHARKLGRETSFTAKQVGDMMIVLGRMGFTPKQIKKATEPIMGLSRAVGEEMELAAHTVGNNIKVFQKDVSDVENVSDIIAYVTNNSAQNMQEFADAASKAGPQFHAAGYDFKEMAASIGVLANMGVTGSIAGTSLRKMVTKFADKNVQGQLEEMGVVVKDFATGKMRPFSHILRDFSRSLSVLSDSDRISMITEMFGERGTMGVMPIVSNIKEIDKFLNGLEKDVKGTVRRNSKEAESGLFGSIKRSESAVSDLNLEFGRLIESTLIPMLSTFNNFIKKIMESIREIAPIFVSSLKTFGMIILGSGIVSIINYAIKGMSYMLGPLKAINRFLFNQKTATELQAEAENKLAIQRQKQANAIAVANKKEIADTKKLEREKANLESQEATRAYNAHHSKVIDNQNKIDSREEYSRLIEKDFLIRESERNKNIYDRDKQIEEDEKTKKDLRKKINEETNRLSVVKKKSDKTTSEMNKLQKEYDNLLRTRKTNSDNRIEKQNLENKIEDSKTSIKSLNGTLSTLNVEKEKQDAKTEEVQRQIKELERKKNINEKNNRKIEDLRNKNLDNEKSVKLSNKNIDSYQKQIDSANTKKSVFEKIKSKLSNESDNIKNNMEIVSNKIAENTKTANSLVIENEENLKNEIEHSNRRLGGLLTQNKKLTDNLTITKRNYKNAETRLNNSFQKVKELKSNLDTLKLEKDNIRIKYSSKDQEDIRRKELAKINADIKKTNNSLEKEQSALKVLGQAKAERFNAYVKSQEAYDKSNERINETKQEIEDKRNKIQSSRFNRSRKTSILEDNVGLNKQLAELEVNKQKNNDLQNKFAQKLSDNSKTIETLDKLKINELNNVKKIKNNTEENNKAINETEKATKESFKGIVRRQKELGNITTEGVSDSEKIKNAIDARLKELNEKNQENIKESERISRKIEDTKFSKETEQQNVRAYNARLGKIPKVLSKGDFDKQVNDALLKLNNAKEFNEEALKITSEAQKIVDDINSKFDTVNQRIETNKAKNKSIVSASKDDRTATDMLIARNEEDIHKLKRIQRDITKIDNGLKSVADEKAKALKKASDIEQKAQADFIAEQKRQQDYISMFKSFHKDGVGTEQYNKYFDSKQIEYNAKQRLLEIKTAKERISSLYESSKKQTVELQKSLKAMNDLYSKNPLLKPQRDSLQNVYERSKGKTNIYEKALPVFDKKISNAEAEYANALNGTLEAEKNLLSVDEQRAMSIARNVKSGKELLKLSLKQPQAFKGISASALNTALQLNALTISNNTLSNSTRTVNFAFARMAKGISSSLNMIKSVLTTSIMSFVSMNIVMLIPFLINYVSSKISDFYRKQELKARESVNNILREREKLKEKHNKNEDERKEVIENINFLRELSKQEEITNIQQQLAVKIVSDLTSKYNGLNLSIDGTTNKINGLHESYEKLVTLFKKERMDEAKNSLENATRLARQKYMMIVHDINKEDNPWNGYSDKSLKILEESGFERKPFITGYKKNRRNKRVAIYEYKYTSKLFDELYEKSDEELDEIIKKMKYVSEISLDSGNESLINRFNEIIEALERIKEERKEINRLNKKNIKDISKDIPNKPSAKNIESADKNIEAERERNAKQSMTPREREIYDQEKEYKNFIESIKTKDLEYQYNIGQYEAILNSSTRSNSDKQIAYKELLKARKEYNKFKYDSSRMSIDFSSRLNILKNSNSFFGKNDRRNETESIEKENEKFFTPKSKNGLYDIKQKRQEDLKKINNEYIKKQIEYNENNSKIKKYRRNRFDTSKLENKNQILANEMQRLRKVFEQTNKRYKENINQENQNIIIRKKQSNEQVIEDRNAIRKRNEEYLKERTKQSIDKTISGLSESGKFKIALDAISQEIKYANSLRLKAQREYESYFEKITKMGYYDPDSKMTEEQKGFIRNNLLKLSEKARTNEENQRYFISKRDEIMDGMEAARNDRSQTSAVGSFSSRALLHAIPFDSVQNRIATSNEKIQNDVSSIHSYAMRIFTRNNDNRDYGIPLR